MGPKINWRKEEKQAEVNVRKMVEIRQFVGGLICMWPNFFEKNLEENSILIGVDCGKGFWQGREFSSRSSAPLCNNLKRKNLSTATCARKAGFQVIASEAYNYIISRKIVIKK